MEIHLGSGAAWVERVDATGSMIGPRFLQDVQSFSLDVDFQTKELKGQYQMPLAVGRTGQKTTGKLTFAAVDGRVMSDIVWGVTPATGSLAVAQDEDAEGVL